MSLLDLSLVAENSEIFFRLIGFDLKISFFGNQFSKFDYTLRFLS